MPYIDARILGKYVKDGDDHAVPNGIADIFVWAIADGEGLPYDPTSYAKYEDKTGQANVHQRILDNLAVFYAKLEITVATANQFAADPRIWTLGFWRRDDDGGVISDNWDDTLTGAERTQAVNYVTANSDITVGQIQAAFDASDTRREIATKLKAFFRG